MPTPATDLYDNAPMPPKSEETPAPEEKTDEEMGETGVLPKSFFQGKDLEPGTECKVRIERVMDNEVMVSYVPHEGEEEAPEEEAATEASPEAPTGAPPPPPGLMD